MCMAIWACIEHTIFSIGSIAMTEMAENLLCYYGPFPCYGDLSIQVIEPPPPPPTPLQSDPQPHNASSGSQLYYPGPVREGDNARYTTLARSEKGTMLTQFKSIQLHV